MSVQGVSKVHMLLQLRIWLLFTFLIDNLVEELSGVFEVKEQLFISACVRLVHTIDNIYTCTYNSLSGYE